MNTLNLPGFTAECALAKSDITYRHDAKFRDLMARGDDNLHPAMTYRDYYCAALWGYCLGGNMASCRVASRKCDDWLTDL